MSEENEENGSQYQRFLRCLDDSQLISHINSLSQQELKSHSIVLDDIQDESTPMEAGKCVLGDVNSSFRSMVSLSSDPFDDGLDDVLANIHSRRTSFTGKLLEISHAGSGGHKSQELGEDRPVERNFAVPEVLSDESEEGESEVDRVADYVENSSEGGSENEGKMLPKHEFGDYATYFHNKHVKQQKADKEYIRWDLERRKYQNKDENMEIRKPIFEGCVIHVNGHTVPSINEIHRLVILHGGKFLGYLSSKGSATHIVCDRLTPRKRIEFKNYRVVRAKWITDCIEQNDLLDWTNYRLMQEVSYGQKRLNFATEEDIEDHQKNGGTGEETEGSEMQYEDKEEEEKDEKEEKEEESDNESILDKILSEQPEDDMEENEFPELEVEVSNKEAPDKVVSRIQKIAMDAKHPDFLKHFFANSRLHHLSTWKADLRLKFLRKVVLEKKQNEGNQGHIPENSEKKAILHVDFDCFFATASCLNHPNLDINKDPIAVTHGGRTSDIASCNYVARKFGVRNGMWSGKAKRLCPELIQLDYDFDAYERYSAKFYDYLISRGIFDHIFPVLIDEVLLDATSFCLESGRLREDIVNELSQTIRKGIFNLTNCSVSVGASHNVLLAKLALKKAKPNGQFYLHENFDEFLDNIPVRDLPGIGNSIKYKLIEEIQDMSSQEPLIKDLKPFTELKLMNIFGKKTGTKLYQFARGIDKSSIKLDLNNSESVLGRKSVSVDVNFGIRFDTVPQVEVFLMNLSKELYSRLISLGMCGSSITLRLAKRAHDAPIDPPKYLGMGLCDFVSKSSKLGVPTNDWGIIGSEIKALFRMVNVPVKELRGIAITMNKLEDVENLKKIRQMRLPFNQVKKNKFHEKDTHPKPSAVKKYRDLLENENIDWEVFNELPEEIKNELQSELSRRGISKNDAQFIEPRKSPKKEEISIVPDLKKPKAYLQQLIPSQLKGPPKYVRVIESPTKSPSKSPRKRKKVSASPSPVKKQTSNVYNDSGSYDDSVLNELPSSIKTAVLKDLEYKNKIKNFDLTPMREKMDKKYKKKNSIGQFKITQQWISMQPKLINAPLFLNQGGSFFEISKSIEGWVFMSLNQGGPHLDDVQIFTDYLRELLKQDNLSRCLNLIKCLRCNLEYQNSIQKVKRSSQRDDLLVKLAINDWNNVVTKYIVPVINEYCTQNYIDTII